jgi:hypothetical protein
VRAADWAWLWAVAGLSAGGVASKVASSDRFVVADTAAAAKSLDRRLVDAGFSLLPLRFSGDWRRTAIHGSCKLVAGVAGDLGQNLSLWERAASAEGTLRFHFRGQVYSRFPRFRVPIEDQVQRQLARTGIWTRRPALVATIESGNCSHLVPDLGNIEMPILSRRDAYGGADGK